MLQPDVFGLRTWITVSVLLLLIAHTNAPALAQPDRSKTAVSFSIDAQPLGAALRQFGDQSEHEVLYDTSLAAGKSSHAVQGRFQPGEALTVLLADTDLTAKYISESVFILLPKPAVGRMSFSEQPASHRQYYGLIQQTLLDVLCGSQETRPGRYRLVLLLWLRDDGRIERLQRLGSIGSQMADQQADAAIGAVKFDRPPPPDFAQPVLLVMLPQASGITPSCGKVPLVLDRSLQ